MKTIIMLMLCVSFAAYAANPDSGRALITKEPGNEKTDRVGLKHVPVHRYIAMLQTSIKKDTQWVVYEQNNETLWRKVQQSIIDKLYQEWRAGRLMGAAPAQAFFASCNRTTMTRDDIANGRLICQVGVAPVKPAEFTVFQLKHNTATSPAE